MKVALLEQNESHVELIPSQRSYLKTYGCEVYLIINEVAASKMSQKELNAFDGIFTFKAKKGLRNQLRDGSLIRDYLEKQGIEKLILNTAAGKRLRNILFKIPAKMIIVGIIHNTDKLNGSLNQYYINSRVNQYIKLASHLKSPKPLPVFFPLLTGNQLPAASKQKPIQILVPGNIDQNRRDYRFLQKFCLHNKSVLLDQVQFIIAGNAALREGPALQEFIDQHQLQSLIKTFSTFIAQEDYEHLIAESHYILPLLHPEIPDFERYHEFKISGSFNLAYAYKKPLLMHKSFQQKEDFKDVSLFYSLENFSDLLLQLPMFPKKQLNALNTQFSIAKEAEKFHNIIASK